MLDTTAAVLETDAGETYDEFLGRFVDAVQKSGFVAASAAWLEECPEEFRQRFGEDLDEIRELIADGVFAESG